MERKERSSEDETDVLVFPFPVQGHINPMLQFAKRLASKGLKVTFLTTKPMQSPSTSISIQIIEFPEAEKANGTEEFAHLFKTLVSERLTNLIDRLNSSSSDPPKALVYDSFLPWALDVAKQFGLHGASFFTQSWSNSSIYFHLNQGTLKVPLEENAVVSLPSMPVLGINDLPSFVSDTGSYPSLLKMVVDRFSNFQEADWLFCNTFKELEHEVIMTFTMLPLKFWGKDELREGHGNQKSIARILQVLSLQKV
ncbi:hypothetical protein QUC31_017186 [Theobroma cacao]